MKPYPTQCTVTVSEVYGTPDVEIPEGHEVIGFQIPQAGDLYLTASSIPVVTVRTNNFLGAPRLILRKKIKPYQPPSITVEEIYSNGFTIPPTYDFLDFRPPLQGEFFLSTSYNLVDRCLYPPALANSPRIVLTKKGN